MSGTSPLAGMGTQTVVRLAVGLSKTPRLKFAWGAPVDAVTVGMRSHWAVLADKLLDVHLHLGFDGEHLLVALAGPEAVVHVNGAQIHGQRWWPVEVPGEIRAGSAVFRVELEGPDTVPLAPNQLEGEPIETVYDGGMLRDRGRVLSNQQAVAATVAASEAALLPTMLSASHDTPAPAAPPPAAPHPTGASPHAVTPGPAPAPHRAVAVAPAPQSAPPVDIDLELAGLKKRPGFWRQASGPKKAIVLLLPLALAATVYDGGLLEPPSGATTKAKVMTSAAPRASGAGAGASASASASAAPHASTTATAGESPAAPAESEAPRLSTLPAAPAAAAAPSVTAAAPTISARPGSSGALPPERAAKVALDLAFVGNLQEAAQVYAELAAANPEQPAFALAARMAAEQAVQRP